MMPRISLVAYEEQNFIFVMVPNERGRYIRTDKCVAYSFCPMCGATVGEPCFRIRGQYKQYFGGTHAVRRARDNRPKNWRRYKPRRVDDAEEVLQ